MQKCSTASERCPPGRARWPTALIAISEAAVAVDAAADADSSRPVELTFSGPCWVDVRDADGETLLFGEMADALRAGIPAITISGQGPDGEMPYWHQVEDTVDKLDVVHR